MITCEEVFELKIPLPDVVAMQCRQPNLEGTGEVRLRRLVKEALRMRPNRIIVGEVRQEEALDLLIALNSGLPGMCTIHANSAREAVVKLCTLPLLAGENVGHAFVVPTVASSVDLVVHAASDADGQRRVPRSWPCRAGSRATSWRPPRSSTPGRGGSSVPRATPRTPSASPQAGYDLAALLAPDGAWDGTSAASRG